MLCIHHLGAAYQSVHQHISRAIPSLLLGVMLPSIETGSISLCAHACVCTHLHCVLSGVCARVYRCVCVCAPICRGQRSTFLDQLSSSFSTFFFFEAGSLPESGAQ